MFTCFSFLWTTQSVFLICSRYSRNQKVLRPFVAPSVSPGSISILIAKQSSLQSFVGPLRSPFKVGPENLSNFQSFPRGQSPPLEKNYYSFPLYCLIQTASLFKNILGSLSKGGKNYKKKFKKNIWKFWKSNIKFKGDWLMAECIEY